MKIFTWKYFPKYLKLIGENHFGKRGKFSSQSHFTSRIQVLEPPIYHFKP